MAASRPSRCAVGAMRRALAPPSRPAADSWSTHNGMSTAYIVMLTAFYVDNGPRLPLWNQLPVLALWFIPAAVGAPVLIRAPRRYCRA